MCDALKKLMKPEIDEAVRKAVGDAINKNRIDTAERMIRAGKLSDQDIADYSGLTVQQIQKIRDKMLTTA